MFEKKKKAFSTKLQPTIISSFLVARRHGDIWPGGGSDNRCSIYLQDSTQIEKSPDDTAVSARCLFSQSVAGGWRRPLPLTQHLSPLRSEHLSFLFVLSYYYYQGNFRLSSSTRQQPFGVSRHFSDWGWSGRRSGQERGDPTSISCPVLVSRTQSEVCFFYLVVNVFLSSFSIYSKEESEKRPKGRPQARPSSCW